MEHEAWIAFILQAVQLDANGEKTSVSGRIDQLHRRGPAIYGEMVSFTNPYTGELITLSGLDMQLAISAFSAKWIVEDNLAKGKNAYIDENGNAVVEDF